MEPSSHKSDSCAKGNKVFHLCREILHLTAPMVFTKGNQSAFVCAVDRAGDVGINHCDRRHVSHSCQIELSPVYVGLWRYLTEMALLKLKGRKKN